MAELLSSLVSELGFDSEDKAKALGGWGIGSIQDELKKVPQGKGLSKKVGSTIPDLSSWKDKALELLGGDDEGEKKGGFLGLLQGLVPKKKGVSGSLANPLDIMGVLEKLGVDKEKAASIPGIFSSFLSKALDKETADKVMSALPFFGSGGGAAEALEQAKGMASEALETAKSLGGSGKKK